MDGSLRPRANEPKQPPPIRRRLRVTGIVQGVGFRPHVYVLASRLGLAGFVGNDSGGVFIELEGPPDQVDRFEQELVSSPPPLAHIQQITGEALSPHGDNTFEIVASLEQPAQRTFVSPDQALCADCRRELFDPDNRRYFYPFINCTNCGPRFTIIYSTPYDRPATTMSTFPMCDDCRREYENPADRRFHAQPTACPICGPQLAWNGSPACAPPHATPAGEPASSYARTLAAVRSAQQVLAAGGVVAVKGLGGYHLACDAANDAAVQLLRQRKGRAGKPLAVMAASLAAAERHVLVDAGEADLLSSRARPIVLLRKRRDLALSPHLAPGNGYLGVMLPYTPLHELLFHLPEGAARFEVLVMTSGNLSEEPIAWRDDDALARLAPLADGFLWHDRPIHVPCDDSVVRVFAGRDLPIRRARGYAPMPLPFKAAGPSLLAVGADLKSSFCLAAGGQAILSQHIGDMGNLETYEAFSHAVEHLQTLFHVDPERLACDAHPGYLSTRWAEEHSRGRSILPVQHHHAHIASLLAEQRAAEGASDEPIIGICWDGTGYGTDGAIWGGEVLVAGYRSFERRAHLRYAPLPGGDSAVRRPYRVALAHLWAAGEEWSPLLAPVAACPPAEQTLLRHQLQTGFQAVPTSSMGRLFDAVAALLNVRQEVSYEAQAAIELEALLPHGAGPHLKTWVRPGYVFDLQAQDGVWLCDPAPLLHQLVVDVQAGVPHLQLAAAFHAALVQLIVDLSNTLRAETGINRVGLSGGVFQNVTLLAGALSSLQAAGFQVLWHHHVPPNDGGIALGQAAVAAKH